MGRILRVQLHDSRESYEAYVCMCDDNPGAVHEWMCTASVDGLERVDLPAQFDDYSDTLDNLMNEVRFIATDACSRQEFTTLSILSSIIADALERNAAFIVISNV